MRACLLFVLALALAVTPALADSPDQAAQQPVAEARQVRTAKDQTPCRLTGCLVEVVGKDRYKFRDKSGTAVVKIRRPLLRGLEVGPRSVVQLRGRVDDRGSYHEVDVSAVQVLR